MTPLSALKQYFGYSSFHPLQEDIVTDILQNKDVFVLMPTGGGKSLCYQLPAVMREGVTVVISPLIALMKDQVDGLRKNGVKASFMNSTMSEQEILNVKQELLEEQIKLLYVAPERVKLPSFIPLLKQLKLSLFAIDEAHCISEWGHDFRPDYRQLILLRKTFPHVPIAALTATAVPAVREDILTQLQLKTPKTYIASFNRNNLYYHVQPKQNSYKHLLFYLQKHKHEAGIIYCQSRKSTESLADALKKDGYSVLPYHAGLDTATRTRHQELFLNDDVTIIVATIAFGMGINKSNVRYVIHYDLPKNIEGYYQETGRAGRDGLRSDCILFFGYGDIMKIEHFLNQKTDEHDREISQAKLKEMIKFAESRHCRRGLLLRYFGERYSIPNCGNCDNCLNTKDLIDGTIIAQKILSCISRTGQRFGSTYIVDVLTGNPTDKILHYRHADLPTFGIGKEYSKRQWQKFIRELTSLQALEILEDPYPILKLNDMSIRILRGEKILLSNPETETTITEKSEEQVTFDKSLFEKLRQLRKSLATTEHVPPYQIFSDATLKELATQKPVNVLSLSSISGIGQVKLKRYGTAFLKEINSHLHNNPEYNSVETELPARFSGSNSEMYTKAGSKWSPEEEQLLMNEFSNGKSISEISVMLHRKEGGIRSRLVKLGVIDNDADLTENF